MAAGKMQGYDVDARMAQIAGKPQRLEAVSEEDLTEEAKAFAAKLRVAFGIPENGETPEVMRLMLRYPALFQVQMDMGLLLAGRGAIPPRERELAILRNAWLIGAPFEWGEHVDIGQRMGVTREEIERCTIGSEAEGWSEHDRAIIKGVEEFISDYTLSDETWDILAKTWNETQLMEFPVLIGQYISTALQQNTLRLRLPASNPGLRHR